MSIIADTLLSYWTSGRQTHRTPSGWIAANAICCGDHRKRGGLILNQGLAVSYSCFNCGFKASWQPGRLINHRMREFMRLLGIDDSTILKLCLEAIKTTELENVRLRQLIPNFDARILPIEAEPISSYINNPPSRLIPVLEYMASRQLYLTDYDFYWSPRYGYTDRLIIPFYYNRRIVGYTARTIRANVKEKYLSEQQPGYVFNLDNQHADRQFVFVCEGPIDAISIDATAILGNQIKPVQAMFLNRLNKEVVVIPDRDRDGINVIEQAIDLGWSVSMPDWPGQVKDANDAVRLLGRLATLWSVIDARQSSALKIRLRAKQWFRTVR